MALKTPLKLKNKPKRVFEPVSTVKPLSSATPGAPTGNVERWLVTHKQTGGVLSVVWDHYWFGARARAEWVHKLSRDDLELRHMPQFEDEKSREHGLSGEMIATRLGMKMHVEPVVKEVNHATGTITLGQRQCGMTFTFSDEPDEHFTCVLPYFHAGGHCAFLGRICPAEFVFRSGGHVDCRREAGHRGEHRGYKKRWKGKDW
jgi:hypothetical protein